jgi:hypothetical protein
MHVSRPIPPRAHWPNFRESRFTGLGVRASICIDLLNSISMRNGLFVFGLVTIFLLGGYGVAQDRLPPATLSLCELQMQAAQGEHQTVRVEGVYLSGLESQYLTTTDCSGRTTDIEFKLKSRVNWKRLERMSNKTNARRHVSGDGDAVLVTFDGEFYGPPVPDAKLPEAIRKNYHPSWDNHGSMTKLVVNTIHSVRALPANHPCAPPKSDPRQGPCSQRAAKGTKNP